MPIRKTIRFFHELKLWDVYSRHSCCVYHIPLIFRSEFKEKSWKIPILLESLLRIQQQNYNTTQLQYYERIPNWLGCQKPYSCLSVTPSRSIILCLQLLSFLWYPDLTLWGLTHIYPCAGLNNPKTRKKKLHFGLMIQFERGTALLAGQHLLSSDTKLGSTANTLAKL